MPPPGLPGAMASNAEAAALLREIADLLDLGGERFKPEAYRRAARSVESLPEPLAAVAGRGELRDVPGIGEAIEGKLREYLATGRIPYLDTLRATVPAGVLELMRLPGVGPKTARRFWVELGITDRAALAAAIEAGRLDGVKGFGTRKIELVRTAATAAALGPPSGRRPIASVYPLALAIRDALQTRAPVDRVEIAGSFRRGRETVGDLDVLVTSHAPERVFEVFSGLPEIAEVKMRGGTKETVLLHGGLQVDLRVVAPEAFGAALQYFTGSKEHNVRLRSLAKDAGLKVNEYGVFRGETRVGGRTEEEVYSLLGVPWIPPELREDRGEIDAARAGTLPRLVERADLTADLHVHLDAGTGALDALRARAHAGGLDRVGVVVRSVRAGRPTPADDRVLEALRAAGPGPPTFVAVVETDGPLSAPLLPGGSGGDAYAVVRPTAPGALPTAGLDGLPDLRLVAHVGGAGESVRPWLDFARRHDAAVEVGPGEDRLDSEVARTAVEMGIRLAVATGVGEPDGATTRDVALGFARRAGATRDGVAGGRAPPRRTRRPRRTTEA
jgi:DNA polymerase (family X)